MDNNNPIGTVPSAPIPVPPPVTGAVPQTQYPSSGGSSKKIVLLFVIGLVVIAALVGGVYFFLGRNQEVVPPPQAGTPQAPKAMSEENLEGDLDSISIDTGSIEDLTSIDTDLQQL